MDDVGGTREEDEIQQAIKLSLQDLGMSYTHENQSHFNGDQVIICILHNSLQYCVS